MVKQQTNHTRVIMIRHAEAEGNIKRIFQGHYDGQVSENGRVQLQRLAERMKSMPFDLLYSSPLSRAVETAQAANRHWERPLSLSNDLMEINGGEWEGKRWADFPRLFPDDSRAWNLTPQDFHPKGGESMRQVYDRIWRGVTEIVSLHPGKTICMVSHGCAIRNFICRAKRLPIEQLKEVAWCDNTGLNVVDFDENGLPTLQMESDVSHLDQSISTFSSQNWWKAESINNMIFE